MSTTPGNPHFREADRSELGEIPFVQAQATLALAYEQRTANLIALATQNGRKASLAESYEIAERLGLPQRMDPPPTKITLSPDNFTLGMDRLVKLIHKSFETPGATAVVYVMHETEQED